MGKQRVLVTTTYLKDGDDIDRQLGEAGFEVIHASHHSSLTLADAVEGVDAVIAGTEAFTAQTLESAHRLRIIARTGVGYDGVDIGAASRLGIAVTTTPGANRLSVAELVAGLMLDCARQISHNAAQVKSGLWQQNSGHELAGSTLGIIGLGSIGKTVASIAKGLGMSVVAFDPYMDENFARDNSIAALPLDDVLACADYVTLHLFLDSTTKHLMNSVTLKKMKPTAYLINTSRGAVVDESALIQAVKNGDIAGAALDVLENEPLDTTSELREMNNVIVTAHIAGATVEARARSGHAAAQNVIDFFARDQLSGLVNPDYRSVRPANI